MSQEIPAFADFALAPPVLNALKKIGYEQPSPIQAESIPYLLDGHDLLGVAQTGTGKTAAFALPLLSRIDLSRAEPQVLVLAPTRELAIQVAEAFQTYASGLKGFHVLPIYGGTEMGGQLRQLRRGAHVIVGTPGRVMDHLRRGTLKLSKLQTVVLDEADEMLRMGFIEDVTWILDHTPDERQVALFSATMPKPIQRMASQYLTDPKEVRIQSKTTTVSNIKQFYWAISGINKLDALTRMLEVETFDGMIMFVRTKIQTVELAEKLEARGYSAGAINGDIPQKQRERTIAQLKSGGIDILVATDVAARGIDVPRISHVINFDIPHDTEGYVHRIGRTGRAGRDGKAILFISPRERHLLRAIEKATRQKIEAMELPSREQVNRIRVSQYKESITEVLNGQDLSVFTKLIGEYLEETGTDPLELASALAFISQKDKPLFLKESPRKEKRERRDRDDRPSFKDKDRKRAPRDRDQERGQRKKSQKDNDLEMDRYRLAVGHNQSVRPSDIVGAIANEGGIESAYIGRIVLDDDSSTVELPKGMPTEVFRQLQKIHVRNHPLKIVKEGEAGTTGKNDSPAKSEKSKPPARKKIKLNQSDKKVTPRARKPKRFARKKED